MPRGVFQPKFTDLPAEVPVFPLEGVLLLPGARLPLNVFEPRYVALVEDSLGAGRLFGMIQPRGPEVAGAAPPPLYAMGCLGRIASFNETEDGRYVITLAGVARFRVGSEVGARRGYRVLRVDYDGFAADLEATPAHSFDRPRLLAAFSSYAAATHMQINAKVLADVKDHNLVDTLSMIAPLPAAEKQALLEAGSHQERARLLLTALELAALAGHEGVMRQ